MENINEAKYYNMHIKKCIDNYRIKHRDAINAKRRENYKAKCNNPEISDTFREKQRANAKIQYQKKKLQKGDAIQEPI